MQSPVLQALVLAERVYEDKRSGGKIIAGTFHRLTIARSGPAEGTPADGEKRMPPPMPAPDMGSPYAYLNLTDVIDGTEILLQMMNVTQNKLLLEMKVKMSSKDRLASNEVVIPLPPLRTIVREPGTYSIDVLWNGEIIGSHRILAISAPEPPKAPAEVI